MEQNELLIRLKILQPEAKFSVWPLEGNYFGETEPAIRCGYRVDWRGESSCPSEDELLTVQPTQLEQYRIEERSRNTDL